MLKINIILPLGEQRFGSWAIIFNVVAITLWFKQFECNFLVEDTKGVGFISGICRTIKHMQTSNVANTILLSCSRTPSCPPSPKQATSAAVEDPRLFSKDQTNVLINNKAIIKEKNI